MEVLVKVYPFVFGAGLLLLVMLSYAFDSLYSEMQGEPPKPKVGQMSGDAAQYALVRASAAGSYWDDAKMLGQAAVIVFFMTLRALSWGDRSARRRITRGKALWMLVILLGFTAVGNAGRVAANQKTNGSETMVLSNVVAITKAFESTVSAVMKARTQNAMGRERLSGDWEVCGWT